jgi:hypothetical protein
MQTRRPAVSMSGSGWRSETKLQDDPDDQLFMSDIDLSLTVSRSLTAACVNARGVTAITNPLGRTLPQTIEEGCVSLNEGQTLEKLSTPTGAARESMEAAYGLARVIGASYGVPLDALRSDGAPSVESGVAILLKQIPLEEARRQRATENAGNVQRLWEIERTMLNLYGQAGIPDDVRQQWSWGSFTPPLDLEGMARRQAMELQNGVIDLVDAIAERHGLTRTEAEAKLQTMEDAKATKAAANPTPAQPEVPVGIMARLGLQPRAARKAKEETPPAGASEK